MLDCLVVGAGHCGLLCGNLLGRAGFSYLIVDRTAHIGDVWRHRPKSLRLFTSRQFCTLDGCSLAGDPEGYATAEEFADYLANFAALNELKLQLETQIVHLVKAGEYFVATTQSGQTIHAKTVINASGANQVSFVPTFAKNLWSEVQQIRCSEYVDDSTIPANSNIVVCGDGATGRQIAAELSGKHKVTLACGRVRKLVPNRVAGHDIFWWLHKARVLYAGSGSLVAKILRKRDPIPVAYANNTALAQSGVNIKPRAVNAELNNILFSDGTVTQADVVIWCVGYKENVSWLRLPRINSADDLVGGQGMTPEPGFFVVGRKWLSCRASELILGADRDTTRVVNFVQAYLSPAVEAAQEGYQPL